MRIILLLVTMSISMTMMGQDARAKKTLDKIAKKYTSEDGVAMDLDLTIAYPEREVEHQSATISQKGESFKYISKDQEIYCDGTAVWYYLKGRNEVQINDYEGEEEESSMTPTGILNSYKTGAYDYGVTHEDNGLMYIELIPKDEYSEYAKYRLSIAKKSNEVKSVLLIGKDGSKVTIDVKSYSALGDTGAGFFLFDTAKYPNVKVEDLRL